MEKQKPFLKSKNPQQNKLERRQTPKRYKTEKIDKLCQQFEPWTKNQENKYQREEETAKFEAPQTKSNSQDQSFDSFEVNITKVSNGSLVR
jgi:hypothetical protein